MLQSPIQLNHSQGELIQAAALILWDEAPMANKAVLHCVDEVCRQWMHNNLPFSGKVFLALGDFRQTCPVIHHRT